MKGGKDIVNEIVFTKKGEIFTNSLIIAQGTNDEHRSIRKLIERYKECSYKLNNFTELLYLTA